MVGGPILSANARESGRRRGTRQWLAETGADSLSTLKKALAGQRRRHTATRSGSKSARRGAS